ncbi:MAG: efflux RND transporter permease subunit [Rikenellaceae bacterium]|nr:efflux RND transporter permease subunit [Rikenellaceae bacterium]
MNKLIKYAVNYPVTILMVVLGILLLGKISYDQLSVDLLPDLNNPRLFIEIKAGERPPEEIEKQYVQDIESRAIRQRDVISVSSVIKVGSARVTVEYVWNKDMDEAFLDLQKEINSYNQVEEITELRITQHDPNTDPVILVGLSHEYITDMAELRKVADTYIKNELTRLEGIADVTLSGDEVSQLVIETDNYKLAAFGLSIDDISSRIQENNQAISGGKVTELGLQYIVKSKNLINDEADFEQLIVGYREPDGTGVSSSLQGDKAPIYLGEIAAIRFENAEPENIVRINGKRSIGMSVYKEMRYNTVKAVRNVTEELAAIERFLPGYRFDIITNQGTFIQTAINEVADSAVMGIVLAVIVLFIYLRRVGTTLIVSIAIPVSIVATFNLMYFNGLTLNIMTLGGIALGAGMLIDNAIVVIENIFRNKEKGMSVRDAAIIGASEVAGAVTASTLTTIVIFLPIVYLHGATGEMFKDQAWTVSFSLLSSLFVAILVIPMLYNYFFGKKRELKPVKAIEIKGYGSFLRKIIKARWLVIALSLILIGFTVLIMPFIGTEFMPRTEGHIFTVNVKMPEGTRLEKTDATVRSLEDLIHSLVQDTAAIIYSHIGPGSDSSDDIFDGENTAMMKVILTSASRDQDAVIADLLYNTEGIEGLELTIENDDNSMSALLGSEGAPVVVEIKGEELDEIAVITQQVYDRMEEIPELFNVNSSVENGAPEMTITIDRNLASMYDLGVAAVISQIGQQLSGNTVGQVDYRGEMRDIIIKVPEVSLYDLGSVVIKSGDQQFMLQEIASIEQTTAPKEIFRRNQSRIGRVMSNINTGYSLDKVAEAIRESVADIELPTNYSITVTGEEEKRAESMDSLMFALMLSVILVYMVLASQFESLLHPFTILLTIPLAVVGAILLFWITGTTINIMGVIGIVMLVGIAVNNSIILVDRINQLKEHTDNLTDAIVQAGQQRIRPIIMTSLTTILALLPMSLNIGEGGSLRSPMAIAVIGGLITSTILSLIVIPCVYYLLETLKNSIVNRKGVNKSHNA